MHLAYFKKYFGGGGGQIPESTMSTGLVPAVLDGEASAGHNRQAFTLLIFTVPQIRH